jgi:hypothetical protein
VGEARSRLLVTGRAFWWFRKHPAQIQSRLQTNSSGGKISWLFDRAVERLNCNLPAMLLVLVRRQFTKNSDCVPNGRDNTVLANQFEYQWREAIQ